MPVTQTGKGIAHFTSVVQVAVVAKFSRQLQTDVILVAMDALVERICVDDLIAK